MAKFEKSAMQRAGERRAFLTGSSRKEALLRVHHRSACKAGIQTEYSIGERRSPSV